jgi:hypothetical protein
LKNRIVLNAVRAQSPMTASAVCVAQE